MNFNILELVYCHKLLWLILRLKCLVLVIRVFKVGVVVEKGGGVRYVAYSCGLWNKGDQEKAHQIMGGLQKLHQKKF